MDKEASIYNALEAPEMLIEAEKEAGKAMESRKPRVKWRMYESALRRVEEAWEKLNSAQEDLENNYKVAGTEGVQGVKPKAKYDVCLYELDKDSHPSTVGMALPKMYRKLAKTREEVMQKFREFAESEDVEEFLEPRCHLK
jgi:hypothetical protein